MESEALINGGESRRTLRNRSTNSGDKIQPHRSSPKESTPTPDRELEPRYAVTTIKRYTPATRDQISLLEGDVLVDLKQHLSKRIWVGQNKRTGLRGIFHEGNVQFHTGSPPKEANIHNLDSTPARRKHAKGTKQFAMIPFVVVVFIAIAVAFLSIETFSWKTRNPVNVTELRGIFKGQDPAMWDTLRAGLLSSKTEAVKTFLFVHAKNGPTTECLIKKLSDNYCVVYRAGEINFNEGFVSKVKDSLQKRLCMVIYDLENLPEEGITVLKGFCDAYTPIVPEAEFYFALDTGEPPVSENVNKVARQKLESMWSKKYSYDEFGGTVTRLTQNVLRVTGEEELPC